MNWKNFINNEMQQDYFKQINTRLIADSKTNTIYPKQSDTFAAFDRCPLDTVRVVILGQDPYHNEGQAHGLSFSVQPGTPIPPSLRNILKELQSDLDIPAPPHGCLTAWAEQGVLLLNSILTVIKGKPASHKGIGWETFTDNAIRLLNSENRPIVYMLFGAYAKSKRELINNKQHLIIEAAHPSPYSANNGFFGCAAFSKTNEFLTANGIPPIDWIIK